MGLDLKQHTSHQELPQATTTKNFIYKKYYEPKIESHHKPRAKKNCGKTIKIVKTTLH